MPASGTSQPKPSPKRNRASATADMLSPTVLYSAEAEKAVLGCMMAQPAEVINDATVADAILDRLVHNAYRLELKGESLRKSQA